MIVWGAPTNDGSRYNPGTPEDLTPPTINCGSPDGLWHAVDVSITCNATDDGTGLANASDASFTLTTSVPDGTETANASTNSHQVCDAVGNCVTAGPINGIKVDKKAPSIIASATTTDGSAYTSGSWTNQAVTVSFTCDDGGSGVQLCPSSVTMTTEGADQSVQGTATDNIGHSASVSFAGIDIDQTPPTTWAAAANADASIYTFGDWSKQSVTVTLTGQDNADGSGIKTTYYSVDDTSCTPAHLASCTSYTQPFTLASDGQHVVTFFSVDTAGNAESAKYVSVWIDTTAPTIIVTTPTANSTYVLNQSVDASYSCSDGGSGVATCSGPVAGGSTIDTSSVGARTFTVNATDLVGNASSKTVSYTVSYVICVLFDQTQARQEGSTIPIKLQLCDASNQNLSSSEVTLTANDIDGNAELLTTAGNANPDTVFRLAGGQYILNLKTTGISSGTHTLDFTVSGDPVIHSVTFVIK